MSHRQSILVLIAVGYVFLMLGNGAISLTHPDEVFYAQTAREMMAHRSWATPYIFDKPQFEKPILFYWLLAAAFHGFGMTPFVARFWPAFFGILGLVLTYALSWLLFRNKRTAFLAGLVLGTSFIYVALSRAVLTDVVFSVWVLASLTAFYYGVEVPRRKTFGVIAFFGFLALAVLTKGLLGICFSLGIAAGYLLWKRDGKFFCCGATVWGVAFFALLTVPWHVLMLQRYGDEFWNEYFVNVHLRRIWEPEHPRCDRWYFYPLTVLGGVMPWSTFLLPALGLGIKKFREMPREGMFLLIWILGIFIPVQMAHSKLASYIFPIFPATAMVTAFYLNHAMETIRTERLKSFWLSARILSLITGALGPGVLLFAVRHIAIVIDLRPVYVLVILLAVCSGLIVFWSRKKEIIKIFCVVPAITASLLVLVFSGKSRAEPWVSCRQICEVLSATDRSDSVVLASKFFVRGVAFYTGRKVAVVDIVGKKFFSPHPIESLYDDDQVLAFLQRQPETFGIVRKSTFHDLERAVQKGPFRMVLIRQIADKYFIKIERENFDKIGMNP